MSEQNELLTVKQAYQAMLMFLEKEYALTKSDELAGLLGGYQLSSDGSTMDPAAWDDWLDAVRRAAQGEPQEAGCGDLVRQPK